MTSVSNVKNPLCFRWRRLAVVPWLLLPALLPTRAIAQDADAESRTAARDLATQGVEAFEQRDFATALDRFERAYSLVPAPSISIMQARSLVQMGRYVEALDRYEKTQRMPLPPAAPDAFKQAVADAKLESTQLWTEVPRLTIHVRPSGSVPKDLTLLLDSKRVPNALLDVSRPADPGPHHVTVQASGYATESRSIVLERGGQVTLDIPLLPPQKPPASLATSGRTSYSDGSVSDDHSSTRTWGWVGVAAGSTGLVLSAVTGVIALGKHSTLEAQCHPGCPASAADDLSTFRTTRTLSYATLLAGSASLGVGGYLLISNSHRHQSVGASVGPSFVGLWGNF